MLIRRGFVVMCLWSKSIANQKGFVVMCLWSKSIANQKGFCGNVFME